MTTTASGTSIDLIGTVTVNPMLSLGVNADFGTEGGHEHGRQRRRREVVGRRRLRARSARRARSRSASAPRRSRTRAERGSASARRGRTSSRVTPSFKFGSNFVLRAEGRYDWVNQAVFMDDKNVAKKNQATVGLNAIWVVLTRTRRSLLGAAGCGWTVKGVPKGTPFIALAGTLRFAIGARVHRFVMRRVLWEATIARSVVS